MKNKETLEEADKKSFGEIWSTLTTEQSDYLKGFINRQREDAKKWQQERSYSEEELLNLLTHFAVEIQRQNKKGQYPIEIKGWFERNKDKFKKK